MKFFAIGFALATLIGLIYSHDLKGDRDAARSAFEVQKENIKSNYIVGWHTGFQAGANSGMNSIGLAMVSNQGTNALEFVRSNVFFDFNLMRPK